MAYFSYNRRQTEQRLYLRKREGPDWAGLGQAGSDRGDSLRISVLH